MPDLALPGFDDPDLPARIDALSQAAIDGLPFGVVRLDAAGLVTLYSAAEAELSGYRDRPALGLEFFTEIAPCMNVPGFRGRLEKGLATGEIAARFGWVGDFADRARRLQVRMQGIPGGGCWLFIRREG